MSRYTTYADGYFLDNAFRNRKVIVVDVRETETAKVADEFIRIKPGGDYAVLSSLRAILRGKSDMIPESVAGVTKTQLMQVAEMCKTCSFGALFFGVGLTMAKGKYKNVRNAIELVDDLNRHTKFTLTPPMRGGHWNVYGANEVMSWMTGYPFAVDFCRGGVAFYNPPGETTAIDVLARKECDAGMIIASDPGGAISPPVPVWSSCVISPPYCHRPVRVDDHHPCRPPDTGRGDRYRCGRDGIPDGRHSHQD